MKRKAKVRRRRDLPPPDTSETPVELSSAPARTGRISIESVDEHKTGSIESVPRPARRTALPASSNPADRMLTAPGRRTCSLSVDGFVFRLGHSIDAHEVDESALHVGRHELDADLLAHLEPTRGRIRAGPRPAARRCVPKARIPNCQSRWHRIAGRHGIRAAARLRTCASAARPSGRHLPARCSVRRGPPTRPRCRAAGARRGRP